MRPFVFVLAFLFSPFAAAAFAQAPADTPSTTPEFAIVGKVDVSKGTVELKFAFHVIRMVEQERQKVVDGKPMTYKAMVPVLQLRVETEEMPLAEILVLDVRGQKVAKDEVLKRVKSGQAVLVNSSDQPLSPAIAKVVAADLLVFISPPEEAEGPAPPVGAPAR